MSPTNGDFICLDRLARNTGSLVAVSSIERVCFERLQAAGFVASQAVASRGPFVEVTRKGQEAAQRWRRQPVTLEYAPGVLFGITQRQRECLDYVGQRLSEGGAPSIAEIMGALKLRSKNSAHRLIVSLVHRGYLFVQPYRSRALALTPAAQALISHRKETQDVVA
jgi:DNA-binding MarR family transcriptional regulator